MLTRPFDETADEDAVASLVSAPGGLTEAKYVDVARGKDRHGIGVVMELRCAIIGYGHALPIAEDGVWAIEVAISEAHRDEAGFGQLTAATMAAVPDAGEIRVWTNHPAHHRAAVVAGYLEIRELRRLGRALPPDTEVELPSSIDLRGFRLGRDEEAWIGVNNAAFADHPENRGWDLARFRETAALPWFDPAGLLMAWEDGRLVGSCWTKVHEANVGEIYIIGVDPQRHGRGLGRTLSLAGLWYLHRNRGAERAILYADADNGAGNAMYEHLGFTIEHSTSEFRVG